MFTTKASLQNAVHEYCNPATQASAENTYGLISTWGTSAITDFSLLFCGDPVSASCNAPYGTSYMANCDVNINDMDFSSGEDFRYFQPPPPPTDPDSATALDTPPLASHPRCSCDRPRRAHTAAHRVEPCSAVSYPAPPPG